MRRLLALLLISTGLALAGPPSLAGACSCVDRTPAERADAADVAVVGTLVDARPEFPDDELNDAVPRTYYTFAVERVYRGEAEATVEILTEDDSPACGTSFDGGRHLVFASEDEHSGDLITSLCHGNEKLDDGAEVPAELGEGRAVAGAAGPDEATADAEGPAPDPEQAAEPIGTADAGSDDDTSGTDLLAALGAVGMGLAVVAAAVAWMVARRRGAA